jgi:soluble lytic murein transglycosylase-like protein
VCTAIVLARRPVGTSKGGLDGETPKKAVPTGPTAISSRTAPSFDVHQRGVETPELRRLLDEQAKLASRCTADPVSCPRGGWASFARDSQTPPEIKEFARSPSNVLLGAWLKPLKIPVELPVRDEQSLRASFEYNAKNRVGKADFQAKLFKCSAYSEIFESALIKYGAPTWLPAVVYRESGCDPGATSAVGAKGLWQFMPESARAYGLRVVEGDVDERLNPIKSTDAAIHFLMDLQHKLGAWDLALAGYNMGPYAVVAILAQIGQAADFWDLVHARALPEETASYVPAIQAYALILNNLSWLQFSRDGHRLESTAEIVVKPGMRLSLIARTAATTTRHIRELNPEFLRDVVPEGEGTARVPDAEAHRAQELLDEWMPDDRRDTCVPEDFDWGANQFERSRYAKNCPENAATR